MDRWTLSSYHLSVYTVTVCALEAPKSESSKLQKHLCCLEYYWLFYYAYDTCNDSYYTALALKIVKELRQQYSLKWKHQNE